MFETSVSQSKYKLLLKLNTLKQNDTYRRLSKHLSSIFIPKRRQFWARLMGSIFSPDSRRLRTCRTNHHASKVSIDTLTYMESCSESNAPHRRRIYERQQRAESEQNIAHSVTRLLIFGTLSHDHASHRMSLFFPDLVTS